MGTDAFVDGVSILPFRKADSYTVVNQLKMWIHVGRDAVVGLDDIVNVNVDKIIEGINVLFNKTFDFQKCW